MKYLVFLCVLFLIAFSIEAQTSDELKSYLPEVKDWVLAPTVEAFNADNLYTRINGSAPLFLENNFKEMTSMSYTSGENYITIQAYRHATPTDAFGMYASERSSELQFYQGIGGEAQGDRAGLYFFAGSMYVKMQANNESEAIENVMKEIGTSMAAKIQVDATYPPIFSLFPEVNRLPHTESYTVSNYIGHEFLKGVYTCNYRSIDISYQVFVVDAKNNENAESILNQYFTFTKQVSKFAEGTLSIKDRYNGTIACVWKDRYIVGIYDENGNELPNADELLKQLADRLD